MFIVQYSTVQYSTVQYSTVQAIPIFLDKIQCYVHCNPEVIMKRPVLRKNLFSRFNIKSIIYLSIKYMKITFLS